MRVDSMVALRYEVGGQSIVMEDACTRSRRLLQFYSVTVMVTVFDFTTTPPNSLGAFHITCIEYFPGCDMSLNALTGIASFWDCAAAARQ
jgi:hypothetical protein